MLRTARNLFKVNLLLLAALSLIWLQGCKGDDDGDEGGDTAFLAFEEIAVIGGFNLRQATGFLGSAEHDALFIAHRENNPRTGFSSEKVIRYDLATGDAVFRYFDREDYITKRLHIKNNELVVIGGSFLNTYSIDLEENLTNVIHGLSLTRFGSALYNDDIYVWGGDINQENSDKVYRWNEADQAFDIVATLPGPKTWAEGEIIDGRLYIFGGRTEFESIEAQDEIYIVDLETGVTATQRLPGPVSRTFTVENAGVIYVSGHISDSNPSTQDLNIFFGIYNPSVGLFNEFTTNLSDEGFLSVNAMTRIENKVYVLYGHALDDNALMSIMEAEIP